MSEMNSSSSVAVFERWTRDSPSASQCGVDNDSTPATPVLQYKTSRQISDRNKKLMKLKNELLALERCYNQGKRVQHLPRSPFRMNQEVKVSEIQEECLYTNLEEATEQLKSRECNLYENARHNGKHSRVQTVAKRARLNYLNSPRRLLLMFANRFDKQTNKRTLTPSSGEQHTSYTRKHQQMRSTKSNSSYTRSSCTTNGLPSNTTTSGSCQLSSRDCTLSVTFSSEKKVKVTTDITTTTTPPGGEFRTVDAPLCCISELSSINHVSQTFRDQPSCCSLVVEGPMHSSMGYPQSSTRNHGNQSTISIQTCHASGIPSLINTPGTQVHTSTTSVSPRINNSSATKRRRHRSKFSHSRLPKRANNTSLTSQDLSKDVHRPMFTPTKSFRPQHKEMIRAQPRMGIKAKQRSFSKLPTLPASRHHGSSVQEFSGMEFSHGSRNYTDNSPNASSDTAQDPRDMPNPPEGERPPCVGAESSTYEDDYRNNVPSHNNQDTAVNETYVVAPSNQDPVTMVDSDASRFMSEPLCRRPVTHKPKSRRHKALIKAQLRDFARLVQGLGSGKLSELAVV